MIWEPPTNTTREWDLHMCVHNCALGILIVDAGRSFLQIITGLQGRHQVLSGVLVVLRGLLAAIQAPLQTPVRSPVQTPANVCQKMTARALEAYVLLCVSDGMGQRVGGWVKCLHWFWGGMDPLSRGEGVGFSWVLGL